MLIVKIFILYMKYHSLETVYDYLPIFCNSFNFSELHGISFCDLLKTCNCILRTFFGTKGIPKGGIGEDYF